MWENQSPEPAPEQETKPTYEELETLYAKAVLDLEGAVRNEQYYSTALSNLRASVREVETYLDENWDEDTSSCCAEHLEAIAEALNIALEVTKTVTLVIEATVEVTAKRGFDFDSISEYDFDITVESSSSEFDIQDTDYSTDLRSVE